MLLRCESLEPPMSHLGHKQTHAVTHAESASPLKADIASLLRYVRSVPKPAVSGRSQEASLVEYLVGTGKQRRWDF